MKRIQPVFLVIVVALWLPILLATCTLFGCHTDGGQAPPHMTDDVFTTTTNVLGAVASPQVTAAAGPWTAPIQAAAAAVLALLAAWQGHAHTRIRTLETNNTTANRKDPP